MLRSQESALVKNPGSLIYYTYVLHKASQVAQRVKNPPVMQEIACNTRDVRSVPGLGRSPGEGNGKPLQRSFLENPMDRRAWQATVHGVAKELNTT